MNTPALRTIVAMAVVFIVSPAYATCFGYGDTVTLDGTYQPDVVSGGSIGELADMDQRIVDLLVVGAPFCIDSDPVSAGIVGGLSLQLLCPEEKFSSGAAVSITGRLVGAHTSNGHIPVLLVCARD
jgi:hypothetical protein